MLMAGLGLAPPCLADAEEEDMNEQGTQEASAHAGHPTSLHSTAYNSCCCTTPSSN